MALNVWGETYGARSKRHWCGRERCSRFSRSDFDGEGQQELDEATPDDDFLGEFGLLIELGDDNQGKLCGVVAVTNLSEESREAFFTNIEGEFPGLRGVGIGRTIFSGFLLAECFLGKLVAIEVLYGLCGVGQNLDDTVVDANFTSFIMRFWLFMRKWVNELRTEWMDYEWIVNGL